MADISETAWSGDASNYDTADAYCKACLIDENPSGADKVKGLCHLPVFTPDGKLSRNGAHNAASALAGGRGGVKAKPESKKAAAKRLVGLYAQLKEKAPPSIVSMAG